MHICFGMEACAECMEPLIAYFIRVNTVNYLSCLFINYYKLNIKISKGFAWL